MRHFKSAWLHDSERVGVLEGVEGARGQCRQEDDLKWLPAGSVRSLCHNNAISDSTPLLRRHEGDVPPAELAGMRLASPLPSILFSWPSASCAVAPKRRVIHEAQ